MIVRNKSKLGILCGLLMVSPIAWARPRGGGLSRTGPAGAGGSVPWNIVVLLSLSTLLPAILLSMTPFVRLLVVFHFLRQALGTQSTPSNQTLIGLALILTYFLMQPVGNAINSAAVAPFERGSVTALQAVEIGAGPLRHFMIKYSSAQVDKRRIGQLAMAIQGTFRRPRSFPRCAHPRLEPSAFVNEGHDRQRKRAWPHVFFRHPHPPMRAFLTTKRSPNFAKNLQRRFRRRFRSKR